MSDKGATSKYTREVSSLEYTDNQIAFENKGQKIYGFLHLPSGTGTFPGIVMLHGFGGEHIGPHALFTKTARALASAGYAVLRFDFRGSGDSEGRYEEVTLQDQIDDAIQAVDFLKMRLEVDASRIALLGLSLGGLIASFAAPLVEAQVVVLWSAVANLGQLFAGSDIAGQMQHATGDGVIDGGGLALNPEFVAEAMRFDPLEAISHYEHPALVIHGTNDETVPFEHGQLYRASLDGRATFVPIEGADHVYSSLVWERQVIETTRDWLDQQLAAGSVSV